ncbi:hypothetical protein KA005_01260, partial [bacterium]|nr:hypothetical protein [bacterium]
YKGTHDVTWTKEKWPRDFIAPHLSSIKIECSDSSSNIENYAFKFEVSEVLDKEADDFEDRLLECLNILQENIYKSDIAVAGSTFSDYLQTIQLSWEILPPGTKEEAIERLFRGLKPTKNQIDTAGDRFEFFEKLNPQKIVYGTSGFQRYFGALLNYDLIIFENIRYGNAIYIMYTYWKELSTKSRIELLSGRYSDDFDRVIHKPGWKKKVKEIIEKHIKQ